MTTTASTSSAMSLSFHPSELAERVNCIAHWPEGRFTLTELVESFRCFGLNVTEHRPLDDSSAHRFEFTSSEGPVADDQACDRIAGAFVAAAEGLTELDDLSILLLRETITWRNVDFIRAAVRFLARADIGLTPAYMVECLKETPGYTTALVELFDARFRPNLPQREVAVDRARARLDEYIAGTATYDLDRTLRGLRSFVDATVRTNWFQNAGTKPYASFKIRPSELSVTGTVTPLREIYVHSRKMEGVHVRADLVARGGLRFSDRPQDYRVEVLDLLATQSVKNAPVVPGGAKGAFVIRPGSDIDPTTAYTMFIRGLLDVVDNLVEGKVVTPPDTVAYDEPDTYLVVAADKGTARMSDIANTIAAEYGFWLGDAFASGGSTGYDHKAMGITARGAWVAVRQRFAALGLDLDTEPCTVVGIGDMSGDVFGNGMLLSDRIRLVAAFDHRHIFLDPDPDPTVSHGERTRLFALPHSSWADYDPGLISAGGGVWSRDAKVVSLSPAARTVLGIDEESPTPADVIRAILCAPVDLLWNGGVGTYVKATSESHADAGDPSNDRVRVDARDLRARMVGEGGNLGMTRAARIEYAHHGGRCDGDFIDNAAGVATSDLEVNIKIAVDRAVATRSLPPDERHELLEVVTDDVADAALTTCLDQALALECAESAASALLDRHERLIEDLEFLGRIDRDRDGLPHPKDIRERARAGQGLVRPELAVLLAQSKNLVASELAASSLPDSQACRSWVDGYFPQVIGVRAAAGIADHPLRRAIVVSSLTDELVNRLGPGALYRLEERFGATTAESAAAYVVVSRVLNSEGIRAGILEVHSDTPTVVGRLSVLTRVVEEEMRWLLRAVARRALGDIVDLPSDGAVDPDVLLALYAGPALETLGENPSAERCRGMLADISSALRLGVDPVTVARVRENTIDVLHLRRLLDGLAARTASSYWSAMGIAALRDEISDTLDSIAATAVRKQETTPTVSGGNLVQSLVQLRNEDEIDAARLAVIAEQLRLLECRYRG